jgi:hypothetical protein
MDWKAILSPIKNPGITPVRRGNILEYWTLQACFPDFQLEIKGEIISTSQDDDAPGSMICPKAVLRINAPGSFRLQSKNQMPDLAVYKGIRVGERPFISEATMHPQVFCRHLSIDRLMNAS